MAFKTSVRPPFWMNEMRGSWVLVTPCIVSACVVLVLFSRGCLSRWVKSCNSFKFLPKKRFISHLIYINLTVINKRKTVLLISCEISHVWVIFDLKMSYSLSRLTGNKSNVDDNTRILYRTNLCTSYLILPDFNVYSLLNVLCQKNYIMVFMTIKKSDW